MLKESSHLWFNELDNEAVYSAFCKRLLLRASQRQVSLFEEKGTSMQFKSMTGTIWTDNPFLA